MFISVQLLSRVRLSATPWTAARQASLSIINSQSLLKLMSIESVMPFNHLCCPLLLLPSIFPRIWVFPMSQFFMSGGWRIAVSASASVLPMNIQDWFPLGKVGSPCSPRGSQESPPTLQFKSINSSALSFLYCPTLTFIHGYWKNHSVESLLFNMLSIVVITFLPRSKRLLILWLQSPPAVILEPQNNKVCHCFHCFPSICHEVMGLDAMILVFWMLSYKPAFSLSSFPLIKRLFSMQPLLVIPITNATPLFPVTQMGNTYRDSPLCQALCWAPSWNMFLLIIILKAKYFPFLTL